jgi:hypothetical protein
MGWVPLWVQQSLRGIVWGIVRGILNKEEDHAQLKTQYIVSDDNEPVGVILDIETFHKIEAVIEDYGLDSFIDEADDDEPLSLSDVQDYYAALEKKI